jgi:hypothetical protein
VAGTISAFFEIPYLYPNKEGVEGETRELGVTGT